jgi:hypothetical protein
MLATPMPVTVPASMSRPKLSWPKPTMNRPPDTTTTAISMLRIVISTL